MVMRKYLYIFALLLAGCGGGGSSPAIDTKTVSSATPAVTYQPLINFETPASIPSDKLRLARIDYRYDTPLDQKDKNGLHTTSFESVRLSVDRIKQIGFNGIILQLQIPINKTTGLVSYYDVKDTDKTIPKDTWRLVSYIQQQGMQVWLALAPVDSITDVDLKPDLSKYTLHHLFKNIIEAQKKIAIQAEQYNINGIFIGECNFGLEKETTYWKLVSSEIKLVYSGKLSYSTCIVNETAIWNHVDFAAININDTLSKTPVYDLNDIVNLYFKDIYNQNQVLSIKNWHAKYGKKFILILTPVIADLGVGHTPPGFWDNVIIGATATNVMNLSSDKRMQQLKIAAFMEMVNKHIPDITMSVGFSEFSPWLQMVSKDRVNGAFYHYSCCGFDLTDNLEAQKTINGYFSKPWGYYTVK